MQQLLDLIRRFEGLRLRAYRCPAGVLTIGYGHTGPDVKPGMTITEAEAEALLLRDASLFVRRAKALSPKLEGARLLAVADFCFNLGSGRYAASTLRRRINAQDWNGAASQLKLWVWGGGKKLPGLIMRRAAEAKMLLAD